MDDLLKLVIVIGVCCGLLGLASTQGCFDSAETTDQGWLHEAVIQEWLVGRQILVEPEGIFTPAQYWTIAEGEVSDLRLVSRTKDGEIASASITFQVLNGGVGLQVSAIMRSRPYGPQDLQAVEALDLPIEEKAAELAEAREKLADKSRFWYVMVDFTPTSVTKIGNW